MAQDGNSSSYPKHLDLTQFYSDKDPSGSDESLIDISEEGCNKEDGLIPIVNTRQGNLNITSRKLGGEQTQSSATGSSLLTQNNNRRAVVSDVTSPGSSHSEANIRSLDHSVPFPRDGSNDAKNAVDATLTQTNPSALSSSAHAPSHTSSQSFKQDPFQSRLLQAQLLAQHQAPSSRPSADHQFFLGDPTFVGSFPPAPSSAATGSSANKTLDKARGEWTSGSQETRANSNSVTPGLGHGHHLAPHDLTAEEAVEDASPFARHQLSLSRLPMISNDHALGFTGDWKRGRPGAEGIDPRSAAGRGFVSFDRGLDSSVARGIVGDDGKAALVSESEHYHKTERSPYMVADDGMTNMSENGNVITGARHENTASTTNSGAPQAPGQKRGAKLLLQGYGNSVAEANDFTAFSAARASESSHHASGAVGGPESGDRPYGARGRPARGPMAFQRNSYGEYSPMPYTSLDIQTAYGSDADEVLPGAAAMSSFRHCHQANPSPAMDKVAKRQLMAVVALCLMFMIGEAVGGALSNSLALFTDVLHLGSDLISFIISLFALFLSNKGATKGMSFGYHRAEVLGALFSVFLIWLVSGVLCYIAVERIIQEHYKNVKPDEMLITASLGVVFNIVMAIVLHSEWCCKRAHGQNKFGHGHSHSHGDHSKGHSHDHYHESEYEPLQAATDFDDEYTERHAEDGKAGNGNADGNQKEAKPGEESHGGVAVSSDHEHKNLNVRAAFIHVIGDIIQSLGVLVAALIIKLKPEEQYRLADPICTFLFSVLVLGTTIAVLRDTIRIMMEGVPRGVSYNKLKRDLLSIDGVVMVHSLHIWALTISRNAIAVHLAVDDQRIHNQVLSSATYMIQTRHRFYYSTIQVELYEPEVMSSCQKCTEMEF